MNHEETISKELFKAIDRTFFEEDRAAGTDAAAQADVMGSILRREIIDTLIAGMVELGLESFADLLALQAPDP